MCISLSENFSTFSSKQSFYYMIILLFISTIRFLYHVTNACTLVHLIHAVKSVHLFLNCMRGEKKGLAVWVIIFFFNLWVFRMYSRFFFLKLVVLNRKLQLLGGKQTASREGASAGDTISKLFDQQGCGNRALLLRWARTRRRTWRVACLDFHVKGTDRKHLLATLVKGCYYIYRMRLY